jgi:hypothetical protein
VGRVTRSGLLPLSGVAVTKSESQSGDQLTLESFPAQLSGWLTRIGFVQRRSASASTPRFSLLNCLISESFKSQGCPMELRARVAQALSPSQTPAWDPTTPLFFSGTLAAAAPRECAALPTPQTATKCHLPFPSPSPSGRYCWCWALESQRSAGAGMCSAASVCNLVTVLPPPASHACRLN